MILPNRTWHRWSPDKKGNLSNCRGSRRRGQSAGSCQSYGGGELTPRPYYTVSPTLVSPYLEVYWAMAGPVHLIFLNIPSRSVARVIPKENTIKNFSSSKLKLTGLIEFNMDSVSGNVRKPNFILFFKVFLYFSCPPIPISIHYSPTPATDKHTAHIRTAKRKTNTQEQ